MSIKDRDVVRVYVAGPYSNEHILKVFANMRNGMRKSTELLLNGYSPFCPWLDYHFTLMLQKDEEISVEAYYRYSLAWLEVSDAVLVLPGSENSKGVQAEVNLAELSMIPVFYNEEELYDYFETPIKTVTDVLAEELKDV